jgi:hypothetical protein
MFNFNKYIQEVGDAIDAARADLWNTDSLTMDRHTQVTERQSARAELWETIMDYREERIRFSELFHNLCAFDDALTVDDVLKLLGDKYHGE